ncbi:AAA family ATPase [uncultured Endozoicomonas sp.]|uniref:AAA family ATPase n=1 Tax=uncultured Endozoicomonas sp. TaxID=432652 RepID=UPI0026239D9B|nr:AAA family ATPase [uncultured Endozoicomonas sp.]
MKYCIAITLSVWLLLLSTQAIQADEDDTTVDEGQSHYLRQYMATHRFFDRLTQNGPDSQRFIEEQIKVDRQVAKQQLSWVTREHPLHNSLVFTAFYAGIYAGLFTIGGVAFNYRYAIRDFFTGYPDFADVLVHAGINIWSLFALYPFIPLSKLFYYAAFPPYLAEENLIITYGSKKNLLNKSTQHYIEDELFYSAWRNPSSDALARLHKILDKVLRLPFYSKELIYNEQAIDSELQNYPAHVRKRLNRFARSELIYQQTDSSINDSHYPVYFQGVSGTGKTHAAKRLAEAMGTNLAIVSLDSATIDDITGTSYDNADAKAGRIIDALIARTNSSQDINHDNQILLIDDFDRLFLSENPKAKEMLSFFQKLLDPEDRSFYSPYLKTTIKLPDTIILAGNHDIHALSQNKPVLEAIVSRLEKIEFTGFSPAAKRSIAQEILIPNKEKRYRSAGKLFENFALPALGYEMIDSFIETDQDIGIRSLEKRVSEVFEYFANGVGI